MKASRRKSVQRERIYAALKNSSAHPTASQLYTALKKAIPTLSLGNLYRNINILVEAGRIKGTEFRDGLEHYDAVIKSHYHFVCETCGIINDFDLPVRIEVAKLAGKSTGNKISGHTIQFFGICEKCLNL